MTRSVAAGAGASPLATQRPTTPLFPSGGTPSGGGPNPWDIQNIGNTGRSFLQQANTAGLFDPTGQGVRRLLRRGAMRRSDALRRRAGTASQLYGLDPFQARGAMVNADIGANEQLAGELSNADLEGLMGQMRFYQQLLGSEVGNANQFDRERDSRKGQGGLGGFMGQLAGAALGSVPFFGGGGRSRERY